MSQAWITVVALAFSWSMTTHAASALAFPDLPRERELQQAIDTLLTPAENACSLLVPAAFAPEPEAQNLDRDCIFQDDVYRKPNGTIDPFWSPRSMREQRHLTLSTLVQITYPNFPVDEGQKNVSELQLAHDARGTPVAVVLQTIHHDRKWQPDGVRTYSVFRWEDIAARGVAIACKNAIYLRGEPVGPTTSRFGMSMKYLFNGLSNEYRDCQFSVARRRSGWNVIHQDGSEVNQIEIRRQTFLGHTSGVQEPSGLCEQMRPGHPPGPAASFDNAAPQR